jgi:hypothetical protein
MLQYVLVYSYAKQFGHGSSNRERASASLKYTKLAKLEKIENPINV